MQTSQLSHQQAMGYDRTSAMFSPDGRLLQVEYAKKSVRQGPNAIGVVCKDGVVLVADRRFVEKLIVPESIEKVHQVDDHIAAAISGIVSDGRVLIERAQVLVQQHKVVYDSPMDTHSLVKEICNIKQMYTQAGGARPFGVSILFAGVDEEPHLFVTDPTGIYFEYKATAVGENETEIKDLLSKEYKENLTIDDAIGLAVRILKRVLGKEFDVNRLDGACVKSSDKKFMKLKKENFRGK